jgi:hypothetical protein
MTAILRLIPGAIWILLFSWRPFFFGFYHDDWNLLDVPASSIVGQFSGVDPSRPLAVVFRLLGHAVVGTSPSGWQVIVIFSHLAAAVSLIVLVRALLRAAGDELQSANAVAALTGAFYLSFPSMLGTAWASGAPFNLATVAFDLSLLAWFAPWSLGLRCIASALAFLVSGLLYEAYWLAFLPFSVLALILGGLPRREIIWLTGSVGLAQVALVFFNRLIAYLAIGANKTFAAAWPYLLLDAPRRIFRDELIEIFGTGGVLMLGVASAIFLLAICLPFWPVPKKALAIAGTIVAGIIGAAAIYAIAGYAVTLIGLFARTSIGVTWWFAIGIAMMLRVAMTSGSVNRLVALSSAAVGLVLYAFATFGQSQHWVESWRQSRVILDRIKTVDMPRVPINSFLLVEVPAWDGVGTFNAPWDTTGALQAEAPNIANKFVLDPPGLFALGAETTTNYWGVRVTNGRVVKLACKSPEIVAFDHQYAKVFIAKLDGTIVDGTKSANIGCP